MRSFSLSRYRIGQLGRVTTGKTPSSEFPHLFGRVAPFLTPTDMDGRSRYVKAGRMLSNEGAEAQRQLALPANSICVVCIGATIGKVCMTDQVSFTNQQVNSVVVNRASHDPLFVYYVFQTLTDELRAKAGGAATPIINKSAFEALEVELPPLEFQGQIAGILSAYDDLIENCQRRIRLLEDMARGLYREWFVHFRFPGADALPRVDSPLGPIPQGWTAASLPECADVNPRVKVPREGDKPFVPMGCLANGSMLITDVAVRSGNSGAKFQNGDTLFARITPCLENGKTGFVQFLPDAQAVAFGSTEFIVLRSRTLTPEFVYLLARSDAFRHTAIKSMTGASGRQRVQEKCFDNYLIAQPPREVLDRFSAIVAPSFRLIQQLHLRTDNLRRTRDLLLPRLLSGQIDVGVAESMAGAEATEPAAAA